MKRITVFVLCLAVLTASAGCARSQAETPAPAVTKAPAEQEEAGRTKDAAEAAAPADEQIHGNSVPAGIPSPSEADTRKQLPESAQELSSISAETEKSAETPVPAVAADASADGVKAESGGAAADAGISGSSGENSGEGAEVSYTPRYGSVSHSAISSALHDRYRSDIPDGLIHKQSWRLLARKSAVGRSGAEETVYLIVYHGIYRAGEKPEELSGGIVPAAMTFTMSENGDYSLKEYLTPPEGAVSESDIRALFPAAAADEALNAEKYTELLKNENLDKANKYLDSLYGNS